MGFFANIIQDSRRIITTDARVPAVIRTPMLAPVSDEGVSEMMRSSDVSKPVKGSELRTQPGMTLEANSGLKTKRSRPQSTTNPKQPQAVQQEITPSPVVIQASMVFPKSVPSPGGQSIGVARDQPQSTTNLKQSQAVHQEITPSPDVIQASMVFPKSVPSPEGQSIGVAPLKETHTFKTKNRPTQSQSKVHSNLGSATSLAAVHKDATTFPVTYEHTKERLREPNDEREVAPNTTSSQKSNSDFIGALRTTEHTHGQDFDVVDDAQEMSVVEATDVRHVSTEVPVSARPDRSSQDKPNAKHAERATASNSTHVQIGQVNIVVEGPSDSKRQPVRLPSSNDLASRTFLRSL